MSLLAADGTPLAPLIRPHVNWTGATPDRLERLNMILGTLEDDLFPGGVIPHVRSGEMHYYAVASSTEQWRQLVPLLRASIGSTITDFTGPRVPFDEDDPLAAILIDNGYTRGASFTAGNDRRRGRYALAALARLRRLVDESQITPATQPRATGEVIRSFELSLAAYDRESAEEALHFLRSNLRLDAINLGFLTVALHATFQEWDHIRRLNNFQSLCWTRRTLRATSELAEAFYQTDILPIERASDPDQAFSVFRETILPEAGNLFNSCPPRVTPATGKAFLLAAATATPANRQLADRLKEMTDEWPEGDIRFFNQLYDFGFPAEENIPATTTLSFADFEAQIEALRTEQGTPTLDRARAGIMAATQINRLYAFQTVVAYAQRLAPDEFDSLRAHPFNGPAFETMLEGAGGQAVPKNWAELIYSLESSAQAASQGFASTVSSEWKVNEVLGKEQDVHELVKAIEKVPISAEGQLFDILPHMVQWLERDSSWPNSSLITLYRAIYDYLMLQLSERWRREAVGTARELLDGMLELGVTESDYIRLLNDIGDVIPPEAGINSLEVLIELAELTASHATPSPDARQRLWSKIIASLYSVRALMTARELVLIHDLGQSFGMDMDEAFPTSSETIAEEIIPSSLDGKTVVIYSLTESVTQRASRLIHRLHPGVRVQVSHDQQGSPRLAQLARHADIFVVCWRSAAHAATEMIAKLRPTDSVTLYPEGKGSSSILRTIEEQYST